MTTEGSVLLGRYAVSTGKELQKFRKGKVPSERRITIYWLTWRNMPEGLNVHGNYGMTPRFKSSTLVKVLCYKSDGRWFDSSWCHWIFH